MTTYSIFSWFLYELTAPWVVGLAVLAFALVQALLLTAWSNGFKRLIDHWLSSDIGYFSMVIFLGMFTISLLFWMHVMGRVLLLMTAEILARLDLRSAGIKRFRALTVLTTVAFLGLSIAWITRYGSSLLRY